MALPVQKQLLYWSIATVGFLLILWLLGDVILPFVLGGAIAYALDPIADRLERLGLPRVAATILITALALVSFVILMLLVIPTLVSQAIALVRALPEIINSAQITMSERVPALSDAESTLRRSLAGLAETFQSKGVALLEGLLASTASLVNVLVLFVIVPVVAFYLLMDWDRMVARVDDLLPRDHAPTIRKLASEIDTTLASFIRGQGLVCLILGAFYAVSLVLIGLNYGLVVGAVAGILTFIPYVGAIVGGALAIGLALFQFWGDWLWIILVAVIFQVGQIVEGNILTPNLVGSSVGLHPVWLIFALTAFGTLFGFVGMLVAVPVAASIGVIVRWGIGEYKTSLLYKGLAGREQDDG